MERTAVNPTAWSSQYGFNQAELVRGAETVLFCSGQTSVDEEGNNIHPGDMRGQVGSVLDNLESTLTAAGMSLSDVVHIMIFTTDVDLLLANYDVLMDRLEGAGVTPASTLLGVARLAFPELMVEIQATAVK